ncbi:unnamed protein product [Camellia sinensis]
MMAKSDRTLTISGDGEKIGGDKRREIDRRQQRMREIGRDNGGGGGGGGRSAGGG